MRKLRFAVPPITTLILVGTVAGASAAAGAVYAAAKPAPALYVLCVPSAGARVLTAPVRGVCPRGTVLHKLPPGARGLTGAAGPAGATGAIGATGATGAAGLNGANGTNGKNGTNGTNGATKVTVAETSVIVEPSTTYTFSVLCPGNSLATGGGFAGGTATGSVVASSPRFSTTDRKPIGWTVTFYNSGTFNVTARAYVVCASP